MGYNMKENRGMICDSISFVDASNVNARNIAEIMELNAKDMDVPMNIKIDKVKEGGMFGKSYEAVVITHPNPPQQYFKHVIIINGNICNFFFFGNSKANYDTNKANARKNTITGQILNSISGSSEMAYQQERFWHQRVHEVFEACLK